MKELVFIKKENVFTTSLIIAEGTENQHESIIRLIQNHIEYFERWGKIYFSDFKSGNKNGDFRGRPAQVAILNEQQATFLVTLLRNNDIILNFKSELVDQFYKMRQILAERQTPEWQKARVQSKITRKKFTDVLKEFIAYAQKQGTSRPPVAFYAKYSKLINGVVGLKNKKDRDNASPLQLSTVRLVEDKISEIMLQGVKINLPYKDVEVVIDAWTNNFKNPFTLFQFKTS